MTYAKNAPGHHPRAKSCIINGLVVSNKTPVIIGAVDAFGVRGHTR